MVDWTKIGHNTKAYQDAMQQPSMQYGSNPEAGLNDYSQYGALSRNPGLGAQQDALQMYKSAALGNDISVAQKQAQQSTALQQRQAMQMHAQGGNLAGANTQAIGAQAGAGIQGQQTQQLLRAQQMQAGMQGLAGLGGQMWQQGLGYNQLAGQQELAGNQQILDWYLGARGLDQQQRMLQQQRTWDAINQGVGAVGSGLGAISQMG